MAQRIRGTRKALYRDGIMETTRRGSQAMVRTAVNHTATQSRDLLYKQNEDMIKEVQWISTLDGRTTPQCQDLDGTTWPVNSGPRPPAHINCFIDYQIPIYTSKGWKKIGRIVRGDLVLTDKGRFKRVTEVLRKAKQKPVVYHLIIHGFWGLHKKLTVTEGHPILVNGAWLPVEDIKPGDKLTFLAGECACGEKIPYFKKWCSLSCKSKHTGGNWAKDPKILASQKKKISENMKEQYTNGQRDPYKITKKANEKTREMAVEGNHPFQDKEARIEWHLNNDHMSVPARKATSERMKKNNPMRSLRARKKAAASRKQTFRKYPEKHPNYIMAQRGHKTWIEKRMAELLDLLGIGYVEQFSIDGYFADFALPEYRIVIETDGEYWHQDKEKDAKRDLEISNHGWQIFHFTDTQMKKDMEEVKSEVCRILNNHDGQYEFIDVEIERVESFVPIKAKTLYNFSVKDDESYIAKGFVVHNCRSTTCPVVKSWRELGIDIDEAPAGTRASMNGQVPEKTTYNDWLKGQPAKVQDDILGPGRGKLFRDGTHSVSNFVDRKTGRHYTLKELAVDDGAKVVKPIQKKVPKPAEFHQSFVDLKEKTALLAEIADLKGTKRGNYLYSAIERATKKNRTLILRNESGKITSAANLIEEKGAININILGSMGGSGREMISKVSQYAFELGKDGVIELTPVADAIEFYIKTGFDDHPKKANKFILTNLIAKKMKYIN
jgi:SPP1 gp7 family putative phage head morphogenesis protein